ncbi:MAG: glucosaminidase domain-containing protein [Oscillospiraceae bacterium]|nr:glucosaminidase domain-containing protein [Oscillospiraceae bacterium]
MKLLWIGEARIKLKRFCMARRLPVLVITIIVILAILFMSMSNYIFALGNNPDEDITALNDTEKFEHSMPKPKFEHDGGSIDIVAIRTMNSESTMSQVVLTEERLLSFPVVRLENDSLPQNEIRVIQEGEAGIELVSIKRTFVSGQLLEEFSMAVDILSAPVTKIIEVGTMVPPAEGGNDIITNINDDQMRRSLAFANLGFNMDLRQPSGLSFEDFRRIMDNHPRDLANVLSSNIEFFYAAEQIYGVNGIFLIALAIHESNWGMSDIARYRNNLFGYGAFDWDPFNLAFQFDNFADGIGVVARALSRNYLNPRGTPIFYGQTATGVFYNGPTLTGVNVRYATDPDWGIKVFRTMEALYGRLL